MSAPFRVRDDAADQRMTAASSVLAYLPRIAWYPATGYCLPVMIVLGLMFTIGSQGITGVLLLGLSSVWITHYALRIIEVSSEGHATPPPLTGDHLTVGSGFTLSGLVLPLTMVTLALRGTAQPGIDLADAALAILVLLLPAHWIALAASRSLASALNPIRLVAIAVIIGPAYGFVCAIMIAAFVAGARLVGHVSEALLLFLWQWLLFACCHLLGFVAYHRHERLGVGVHVQRPTDERRREREQAARLDALMAELETLSSRQGTEAAARRLYEVEAGPADARAFHEVLFERLKERQLRPLAMGQAARLVGFLVDRRQLDRALDIATDGFDLTPDFRFETALHVAPLVEHALRQKQDRLLERLVASAERHFPGDPALRLLDAPRLEFEIERRKDDDAARRLLATIEDPARHPHAARLEAFRRLLGEPAKTPSKL